MTVGQRLGFDVGGALARVQLVQWSECLESAGAFALGALLGLLLVKEPTLPGLNFLWMSSGCALFLKGILRGVSPSTVVPPATAVPNCPGLVMSPGPTGVREG